MKNTLKKFFNIIKEEKKKFFFLSILFICLSFLEAISIGLVMPFLEALTGNINNSSKIIKYINLIIGNHLTVEVFLSGLILFLFVTKNTLHYFFNKVFFSYCFYTQAKIRVKILNKIKLDYLEINPDIHEINKLVISRLSIGLF